MSSLSPSGGLLNPYCLFSQTAPLISPRDRSRHTGLATRRETQRGGGMNTSTPQSPTDRNSVGESVLFGRENGEKKSPRREVVGWLATGGLLMGMSRDDNLFFYYANFNMFLKIGMITLKNKQRKWCKSQAIRLQISTHFSFVLK